MFETLRAVLKNADLKRKILFTILVLLIFRIGVVIPVPFIDTASLGTLFSSDVTQGLTGMLNIMSGGALAQAAIFALGISPYINASIIMQLLTIAIPALERLSKEENGQKKVQKITRYVSVGLSIIMGYGYYTILNAQNLVTNPSFIKGLVIVSAFTAGAVLVMWMAEQINDKGIGNGVSMVILTGILSQGNAVVQWVINAIQSSVYWAVIVVAVIAVLMIAAIVFVNQAERRIPIQYAKRVVGRKMYGGNNSHLPMKVMMTGVMPIIFASSFCMLPSTIAAFVSPSSGYAVWVSKYFSSETVAYAIVFFLLIIFFNYFYVSVTYNPVEIANNLQKQGGSVPGIRPGEPTAKYIQKALNKITLFGAFFLGLVALLPMLFSAIFGLGFSLGGNSMLIVVSIILELAVTIESQLMMRHYKGFLD